MSHDIAIAAPDGASSLAWIGEVLGSAGVDLMGGGMWEQTAHYLVHDAVAATRALEAAGLDVLAVREALLVPLDADVPGELGRLMQRLVAADVRLEVQYSDHDNRKVFVVDDLVAASNALGDGHPDPVVR